MINDLYMINTVAVDSVYTAVVIPWSTELLNAIFLSLEVVIRYRDSQLQVTENYLDLRNYCHNLYQCFDKNIKYTEADISALGVKYA